MPFAVDVDVDEGGFPRCAERGEALEKLPADRQAVSREASGRGRREVGIEDPNLVGLIGRRKVGGNGKRGAAPNPPRGVSLQRELGAWMHPTAEEDDRVVALRWGVVAACGLPVLDRNAHQRRGNGRRILRAREVEVVTGEAGDGGEKQPAPSHHEGRATPSQDGSHAH